LLLNPNGGNVGIGTTAPGIGDGAYIAPLTINSASSLGTFLAIKNTEATYGMGGVWMQANTGNAGWLFGTENNGKAILHYGSGVSETAALTDAKDGTKGIAIDTTGNVGIGTTTPQNTLNVVGIGNFSKSLTGATALLIANNTDISTHAVDKKAMQITVGDAISGSVEGAANSYGLSINSGNATSVSQSSDTSSYGLYINSGGSTGASDGGIGKSYGIYTKAGDAVGDSFADAFTYGLYAASGRGYTGGQAYAAYFAGNVSFNAPNSVTFFNTTETFNPACGATYNHSMISNASGWYICGVTGSWTKIG
jgi:hypothetical protein